MYASLMCGCITNQEWPDVESAPFYKKPGWHFRPDDWKAKEFGRVDEMSLDFVRSMLQADPTRRPTAADVVASTFWVTPVRQYGSDGDVRMEGLPHSGMLAGMPSSTRLSTTPTTKMSGASHDTANDGEVGASHSAQMLESATTPDQEGIGADLYGRRCQCRGPWSCGSFTDCLGGKNKHPQCLRPTAGEYCSHCVCRFCEKVRHKSHACYRHQWKLATTEYKFVRAFGPSLTHMGPEDVSDFVVHGAESQILNFLAAAVLAAQMWCPVAVRFFCSAVQRHPQEAKAAEGLMNIFIATVRHASDVSKDERHIEHKILEDIRAESPCISSL